MLIILYVQSGRWVRNRRGRDAEEEEKNVLELVGSVTPRVSSLLVRVAVEVLAGVKRLKGKTTCTRAFSVCNTQGRKYKDVEEMYSSMQNERQC